MSSLPMSSGSQVATVIVGKPDADADPDAAPGLTEVLTAHLGPEAALMPVTTVTWAPYEHVNVQGAVDRWLARNGAPFRLVGIAGFRHRMFGLSDLFHASGAQGMAVGGVSVTDQPIGPGEQTRTCVQAGLYLVDGVDGPDDGDRTEDPRPPLVLLLRGTEQRGPQPDVSLEIACSDRALARKAAAEIRRLAVEFSVYRGHVIEFGAEVFGPHQSVLSFHERPVMTREELILPPGMLEGIEAQILGVNRHRAALLAHGQHLKRGVLLFGPPGTGKTHTVRYLMSRLPETTVVVLTANALRLIGQACEIARALQPALVVVEDVDLIAQDRSNHMNATPLLFQLLNEMDGLDGDADVTFLLTTNRVDVLEPALAMRPGRVDHAVEVPLPDATGRARLLELYRGGLDLDLSTADSLIERTAGVTASFIKELIRRATLISLDKQDQLATGSAEIPTTALRVSADHLDAALAVLTGSRHALTRRLLGAPETMTD
ncbi:AAA family ATPase [Catenulispora pinisilvae]|uniref:AAA family ATPase n=1 Tax=Catenulispora pinisilvae TaxID=2705253 RepID=UPI0018920BF5|nr:AAA family ATPase [Catenulispora pinisilvae]